MITHISGASGAGKTTLGNKLKAKYGNKIVMKDIDDMRDDFYNSHKKTSAPVFIKNYCRLYQDHMDVFIAKHKNKIIIFVGLNVFINGEELGFKGVNFKPKLRLNTHATRKFYIKLNPEVILKQRYDRNYKPLYDNFYKWVMTNQQQLYKQALNDEIAVKKEIIEFATELFQFAETRKDIDRWGEYYKKEGYKFMSRDQIYKAVVKLI